MWITSFSFSFTLISYDNFYTTFSFFKSVKKLNLNLFLRSGTINLPKAGFSSGNKTKPITDKQNLFPIFLLGIFLFFGFYAQAQSINEQFKTVVDGSNDFQEYKVIKQPQINNLWKNTVDTLTSKEAKYAKINAQLSNQKSATQKQQKQLAEKEKNLQQTLNSANEISFLGFVTIEKGSYRISMWTVIFILAALAIALYFIAFPARKEAKYRIKLFEEVQEEYKTYKLKANDNEKKLARELQDERNKLADFNIR